VAQLRGALQNYLALFEEFYSKRKETIKDEENDLLFKEIENSIPKLWSHCIKQGWSKLGWDFLRAYLNKYPFRFASVIKTVTVYFFYCKLQEVGLKKWLQEFRTFYSRYSSRKMVAQSERTIQ
ncbi:MAG TPA: hypothetical protein VIQ31_02200, partial [Phormidium sp.]